MEQPQALYELAEIAEAEQEEEESLREIHAFLSRVMAGESDELKVAQSTLINIYRCGHWLFFCLFFSPNFYPTT